MSLHLISFKTCPFVQRAVITLKHKNIDFDITYIDLAEPPDWFLEMSPLGKVPVLKVDDEILCSRRIRWRAPRTAPGSSLPPICSAIST
jgi:hypothetical protein